MSPTLDETTVAALIACDRLLIPTQLNPLALDGVAKLSKALFKVATLMNRSLADFAVLPNQVDLRANMQRETLGAPAARFRRGPHLPSIRVDVGLAEAFGAGLPARAYRPQSRGAFDYARLADHVLETWGGQARPAHSMKASAAASTGSGSGAWAMPVKASWTRLSSAIE